jgi:hypothetical protein
MFSAPNVLLQNHLKYSTGTWKHPVYFRATLGIVYFTRKLSLSCTELQQTFFKIAAQSVVTTAQQQAVERLIQRIPY